MAAADVLRRLLRHDRGVAGVPGATTSLVFNIIGSLLVPALGGTSQHPLRLIQVYLTFPLGESALKIDDGVTLAIGCCLYLATGMLYGMIFQLVLTRMAPGASLGKRLVLCSLLALVIWVVNFYGVLSWLQPLLFGGNGSSSWCRPGWLH